MHVILTFTVVIMIRFPSMILTISHHHTVSSDVATANKLLELVSCPHPTLFLSVSFTFTHHRLHRMSAIQPTPWSPSSPRNTSKSLANPKRTKTPPPIAATTLPVVSAVNVAPLSKPLLPLVPVLPSSRWVCLLNRVLGVRRSMLP